MSTEQENVVTTQTEAISQEDDIFADLDDGAELLAELFEDAFDSLVKRRDGAYAAAIAPLDREEESLAEESANIEEAASSLQTLLPAKARIAQYEADQLEVAGKNEEAEAKREEMRQAEAVPAAMQTRQAEIADRIEAIENEKKDVARRVAEAWWRDCAKITKVAEHGLIAVLLNGLRQELQDFTESTGTATYDSRFMELSSHDLTTDADTEVGSIARDFWYKTWGLAKVRTVKW